MNARKRIVYWKYKRRANRIEFVAMTLGPSFGIEYARRRGWLDEANTNENHIQLCRTGKWFR